MSEDKRLKNTKPLLFFNGFRVVTPIEQNNTSLFDMIRLSREIRELAIYIEHCRK